MAVVFGYDQLTNGVLVRNAAATLCMMDDARHSNVAPALRRWLKLAQRSAGKQRLAYLIQHIINTWVWTLDQRRGTPCMPLIITYRCSNDASCGGIGDRIKGLSMAFWMVRVDCTWRACLRVHR